MILELQLEGNCHSLGLKTFKRKKESVSQLRQIFFVFFQESVVCFRINSYIVLVINKVYEFQRL